MTKQYGLTLLVAAMLALYSQTAGTQSARADASLSFEVASVKPNRSETAQTSIRARSDGVTIVNLALRAIIQLSFQINQPSKLSGLPGWASSEHFDIVARTSAPATDEEVRSMMQTLLADRFKLVARRETREVQVLALTRDAKTAKLGPNIIESKGCIQPRNSDRNGASSTDPVCGPKPGEKGRLVLTGVPITQFASLLSLMLGRTVIDKTGLTGQYDINLTYSPNPRANNGATISPTNDGDHPDVVTAVREQLGLRLESQRSQEEILVIDHVERPGEN